MQIIGDDLAQQDNDLLIVAVTGHFEDKYIKKALDHGMNQVIPKPITAFKLGMILMKVGFLEKMSSRVRLCANS